MKSFFVFLKHCFDFKGKTNRKEFIMCSLSFAFIGGFLGICESILWLSVFDLSPEIASRFSVVLVFGLIAFYSMSCRRLRDAGCSEKTLKWITFPFGPHIAIFISFFPIKFK